MAANQAGKKAVKNTIEALRTARGWTMEDLAARMGVSVSSVNRLEKGERKFDVTELMKLMEIFDVGPDVIVPELSPAKTIAPVVGGLDDDAKPYDAGPFEDIRLPDNQDKWIVNTDALSAIGIDAGDAIIVDISQEAVENVPTGEAVIIQHYYSEMKARTLLRQHVEPNLFITNSRNRNGPFLDAREHDVRIKGVVISKLTPIGGRGARR